MPFVHKRLSAVTSAGESAIGDFWQPFQVIANRPSKGVANP
jgi:hypothetical protein